MGHMAGHEPQQEAQSNQPGFVSVPTVARPMPPIAGTSAEPPLGQPWYGIGFRCAVIRFWRKGLAFSGRASRGEYWWAMLFLMLVAAAVAAVTVAIDVAMQGAGSDDTPVSDTVSTVLQLIVFLPALSLTVRRLHDANHSGWWAALPFVFTLTALVTAAMSLFVESWGVNAQAGLVIMTVAQWLLGYVAPIVFGVMPSKPAGARFDAVPGATQGKRS